MMKGKYNISKQHDDRQWERLTVKQSAQNRPKQRVNLHPCLSRKPK